MVYFASGKTRLRVYYIKRQIDILCFNEMHFKADKTMSLSMEFVCTILFTLTAICSLGECGGVRLPRRTGDQATPGDCLGFGLGGVSHLHFYACCNNCNDTDSSCNGKTYQSASTENYCDACGVDNTKGNGVKKSEFYCGGCSSQDSWQTKCLSNLNMFYHIPGLCWAFLWCFERNCKQQHSRMDDRTGSVAGQLAEGVVPVTCFNLVCETGETVDNCPTDCCGQVNPPCAWQQYNNSTACPAKCCGTPSCCRSAGNQSLAMSNIVLSTLLASLFIAFLPFPCSLII